MSAKKGLSVILKKAVFVFFIFSFLLCATGRLSAASMYVNPVSGAISAVPISHTFYGRSDCCFYLPEPMSQWKSIKVYVTANFNEDGYIVVYLGDEGVEKYFDENSTNLSTVLELNVSNYWLNGFWVGISMDDLTNSLTVEKIELVPAAEETSGYLASVQTFPGAIQLDRGGNSQPVELLALAAHEMPDGTTVKFQVKDIETGETIYKKKASIIDGQATVNWRCEAEQASTSHSYLVTATAGSNEVDAVLESEQIDTDFLGAVSLNSSADPLAQTSMIDTTLGFNPSSVPQTFARPELNLAEPINPVSGNFVFPELDIRLKSRLDLALLRAYNSLDNRTGIFGRGWSSTFSSSLTITANNVIFHNFDGSSLLFRKEADQFISPSGSFLSLSHDENRQRWTLASPQGKAYRFDDLGHLTAVSTTADFSEDSVIAFTNNDKGLPVKISNPAGQWFEISYSDADLISKVSDSTGRKQLFEYDEKSRLIRVVDPVNRVTTYEYNPRNLLVKVTKPGNLVTEIAYQKGRAVKLVYPNGNKAKIKWFNNEDGNKIVYNDSTGVKHIYQFTPDWSLKSYVPHVGDIAGPKCKYEFKGRNLVKLVDQLGNVTRFAYSAQGLAKSRTDAVGQTEYYKWNAEKARITQKTDVLGREWQYKWNQIGKISQTTDPLNGVNAYAYDRLGNLTQSTDPKNRITKFKYDEAGNFLKRVVDPLQTITKFSYDARGNVTKVINPLGQTISYKYDKLDRLKEAIYPDGQSFQFFYSDAGDLILRRDQLGRETGFSYDKMHNLLAVTRADGQQYLYEYDSANRKISQTDTLGRVTKLEYEQFPGLGGPKRLTKIIYPDETFETFEYDLNGRLIASTDALGHRTSFEYDPLGRLLKTIDPAGSVWLFAYDSAGRKLSAIDPLGRATSYAYDQLDRPLTITYPDNTCLSQTFDEVGNLVSVKDALNRQYSWEYDALNRVTKTIYPDNNSSKIFYNAIGQTIKTVNPLGCSKSFVYDSFGRILELTDENNQKYLYHYDNAGRLVETIDPTQSVSSFSYDIFNRIVAYKDPCGNVSSFEYDSEDRVIAFVAANGSRWQQNFDLRDRLLSRADPTGAIISFSYDSNGQRLSLNDAENRVWRWEYDVLGRSIGEIDPLGNRKATGYDAVGNIIWRENARGARTTYDFDSMDRLLKVAYPDQKIASFAYDTVGREISRSGSVGTVIKTWDDLDRLTSETFSLLELAESPKTWQFFYNPAGYRVKAIDPQNKVYSYQYDPAGNLTKLHLPDCIGTLNKKYDALGRLVETSAEGIQSWYQYDRSSRLINLVHEKANGRDRLITSRSYQYNPVGSLVSMVSDNGQLTSYQYDPVARLVKATYPEGQLVNYLYDNSGNRIEEKTETPKISGFGRRRVIGTETVALSYSYDAAGRMIAKGSEQYSYDEDGNLTKSIQENEESDFYWSADNRLLKVEKVTECKKHHKRHCQHCCNTDSSFEEYEYLPEDWRRVVRKTNTDTFVSIYDMEDESHEYFITPDYLRNSFKFGRFCWKPRLPQNVLLREFVGGPDTDDIEALRYHGRHLWQLKDALGSTIALANRSGQPLALINYDAFGNFRWANNKSGHKSCHEADLPDFLDRFDKSRSFGFQHDGWQFGKDFATAITPYLFAGRRHQPLTNQYFNRNRYYAPGVGRFITSDPIGFNGGDNLYAYANNKPTTKTDPFGLISPGDVFDLNIGPNGAISMSQATAMELQLGFETYVLAQSWVQALIVAGIEVIPVFAGVVAGAALPPAILWAASEPTLGPIGTVSLPYGEQIVANTNTTAGINAEPKTYMMSTSSGGSNNDSSGQSGKGNEVASERTAKDIAKQIERDLGKDARREFHDLKEGGDRTLNELKEHARQLYNEQGKTMPKWLR